MKHALVRHLCRLLILGMGALPLGAYAGLITTDQVAATAQTTGTHDPLRDSLVRSEVRAQLLRLGIDGEAAQARVAAMTEAEVESIAGRIDSLPAGGVSAAAVIAGVIVLELIWYFWVK